MMNLREIPHPFRRGRHELLLSNRGMTLIEIMIVVTIMASIMGVVGVFVVGYLDRANIKEAEIEIGKLRGLVDSYYVMSSPRALPNDLQELAEGPAPLTQSVPADPWGTPYVYRKVSNREYEIFSAGPDAAEGTEDDVRVGGQ